LVVACLGEAEERIEAFQTCMGTQFRVTVLASDIRGAQQAIGKAFQRGAELDAKLSDYRTDSELNQLCSKRSMQVSEDLRRVLEYSLRVKRETNGAFDIAIGPLIRRWREARRTGVLPAPARVEGALELRGNRATLTGENMRLDLGGIAKGFAAEEMLSVLRSAGFPRAMVAASGDLAIGEGAWRIELGATGKTEMLENCFVSTSGDESQFVEIGGVRYSHIVDPRTGLGIVNSRPVTVIARQGMEADALATALQVRPGLEQRIRRKHPGIRILY
jgi:FAD:protein FMN transferase